MDVKVIMDFFYHLRYLGLFHSNFSKKVFNPKLSKLGVIGTIIRHYLIPTSKEVLQFSISKGCFIFTLFYDI